jgi:SM-20-related protein
MTPTFRLNPAIEATACASIFQHSGRVRISAFLAADGAVRLREELSSRTDWKQVINSGEKLVELDRATREQMSDKTARDLDTAVYVGARSGFQFRYETLRVPDDQAARQAQGGLLSAFAQFLSSGEPRELLRSITAQPDVAFVDCQATAYAPGDFLTAHDDNVPGKNRVAAYVLSLNPKWRSEWGGLLLMHRPDRTLEGLPPDFGTLDLFRVGQMHSVSEVTRAAPWRRYSVTGWLRKCR